MRIDVMDTTLRDGGQTPDASFSPADKFLIVQALLTAGVRRIEVASALVPDELETVQELVSVARSHGHSSVIEVLGFADRARSVDWILESGAKVMNLLTKGSLRHCKGQLRLTPREHFEIIEETVNYAVVSDLKVNVYLEDWSQGVQDSPEYVVEMIQFLRQLPIGRLMFCDTLGVLCPEQVSRYLAFMAKIVYGKGFDFHGHNDYGLATANSLAAVRAGATAVHVAVNGLGERAGNAPLDEVIVGLRDFLGDETGIDETRLCELSQLVSVLSQRRVHVNKPIVGRSVFSQTAGVHIDGDRKGGVEGALYVSRLHPHRFRRETEHALTHLGGVASLRSSLERLGLSLNSEQLTTLAQRVAALQRHRVCDGELYYLLAEVLNRPEIINFRLLPGYELTPGDGVSSGFRGYVEWKGQVYGIDSTGKGTFDAFMVGMRYLSERRELELIIPEVLDHDVSIPPGGKSDALVEAIFDWRFNGTTFTTTGFSPDSSIANIKAAVAAINLANRTY